jgi:hypothetical protein
MAKQVPASFEGQTAWSDEKSVLRWDGTSLQEVHRSLRISAPFMAGWKWRTLPYRPSLPQGSPCCCQPCRCIKNSAETSEACQTHLLAHKSSELRKRLDRYDRDDTQQVDKQQERTNKLINNQTLVQFLQRFVADRIGNQRTKVLTASGDHKVFTMRISILL